MTSRFLTLLMTFALATAAIGADSEDRTHPLDDTPACMERGENAAAGNCVLNDSRTSPQMIPSGADTETMERSSPESTPGWDAAEQSGSFPASGSAGW